MPIPSTQTCCRSFHGAPAGPRGLWHLIPTLGQAGAREIWERGQESGEKTYIVFFDVNSDRLGAMLSSPHSSKAWQGVAVLASADMTNLSEGKV